jgi:ribosome biogenesis GTPase
MRHPKKSPRAKDVTSEYLNGSLDDDRLDNHERFTERSKHGQANKTLKTAQARAAEPNDIDDLPIGEVTQVFSLFCEVLHAGGSVLCVVRKTLSKVSNTALVVGDRVRFRPGENHGELVSDKPAENGAADLDATKGVVEQIMPRKTVLTRTDSFKGVQQHPIVANADQMLIVAALHRPKTKWGLIDRMLIAAQAGGLIPILCLNKVDLDKGEEDDEIKFARAALDHYRSMNIRAIETSIINSVGLNEIRELLVDRVTVLAGHSGVGKSSLISAVVPGLVLKVGEVSEQTEKGRHTTTSAAGWARNGDRHAGRKTVRIVECDGGEFDRIFPGYRRRYGPGVAAGEFRADRGIAEVARAARAYLRSEALRSC